MTCESKFSTQILFIISQVLTSSSLFNQFHFPNMDTEERKWRHWRGGLFLFFYLISHNKEEEGIPRPSKEKGLIDFFFFFFRDLLSSFFLKKPIMPFFFSSLCFGAVHTNNEPKCFLASSLPLFPDGHEKGGPSFCVVLFCSSSSSQSRIVEEKLMKYEWVFSIFSYLSFFRPGVGEDKIRKEESRRGNTINQPQTEEPPSSPTQRRLFSDKAGVNTKMCIW